MSVRARVRQPAALADRKARAFLRKAELVEISDCWRPHRSLAVSYLFASEYDGPH